MRTERSGDRKVTTDASLSRRSFVLAGGSAAGTVAVGGVAAADDRDAPVVGATEPYLPAVREAATAASDRVRVRPARELGESPAVLVSGRPEASDDGPDVHDAVIDGGAALTNPDGTWRDVLARSEVRSRWASDSPVETWSECESVAPDDLEGVERPDGFDGSASTLVRGTRAHQYAEGRGGVGYYDVDREAIVDAADAADGSVSVVRRGYVRADAPTVDDERVSTFLDSYGERPGDPEDDSTGFVDPASK